MLSLVSIFHSPLGNQLTPSHKQIYSTSANNIALLARLNWTTWSLGNLNHPFFALVNR